MRVPEILAKARDFDVDPVWAVTRRLEYLTGKSFDLKMQMLDDLEFKTSCETAEAVMIYCALNAARELRRIKMESSHLKGWVDSQNDKVAITDDDIAEARRYPVDRLVEFIRGKTTAWCHEDRNPSAYHGTRTNTVVCPVCDLKFGPIDVLMKRDGMGFVEAVKHLTGR